MSQHPLPLTDTAPRHLARDVYEYTLCTIIHRSSCFVRVISRMGDAKEGPRGCDEDTWFVRLVSSLLAPVRDIVTGAHQLYWLQLSRQLGYLSTRRAGRIPSFDISATAL